MGGPNRRQVLLGSMAAAATGAVTPVLAQHEHHGHGHHGEVFAQEKPLARSIVHATGDDLRFPEVRRAENGVLKTTLRMAYGPTDIDGERAIAMTYDGSYPGPTLVAKPGDTIKIRLINDLNDVTNLHTHGLHVSPSGNSDNVMLVIQPGETFDYEIKIPEDHMPGTYWYHPHVHGLTYPQVSGGLAGALIIEGGLDEFEGIKDRVDQLMVIQSCQFDDTNTMVPIEDKDKHKQTVTINGQINPTLRIRAGEVQRWRLVNATAESFLMIGLEGHLLYQISKDGNAMTRVVEQSSLLIEPGTRADVLVQGYMFNGAFELRKMLWYGAPRQFEADELLATLVVEGEDDPVTDHIIPTTLVPLTEDFRDQPVDKKREIRFDVVRGLPGGTKFTIDGRQVDMGRVDQTVKLGAFEEWELINDSPEWHPFHIHANDFQVVAVNGEPMEILSFEDTRGIPPNGSLTIRHRFLDFTGKYVYHCHLLFHEDHGMMGIVEVVE